MTGAGPTYTDRVDRLRNSTGVARIQFAAGVTVLDDVHTVVLTGSADRDWSFSNSLDGVTGLVDN